MITPELIVRLSKDAKRVIFTDTIEKFIIDIKRDNKNPHLFNNGEAVEFNKKPELKSRVITTVDD